MQQANQRCQRRHQIGHKHWKDKDGGAQTDWCWVTICRSLLLLTLVCQRWCRAPPRSPPLTGKHTLCAALIIHLSFLPCSFTVHSQSPYVSYQSSLRYGSNVTLENCHNSREGVNYLHITTWFRRTIAGCADSHPEMPWIPKGGIIDGWLTVGVSQCTVSWVSTLTLGSSDLKFYNVYCKSLWSGSA